MLSGSLTSDSCAGMNILYLYSEIGPYNIPIFRCLTEKHKAVIHVIHWDHKRLKPYVPKPLPNVFYHARSHFSAKMIYQLACGVKPALIYVVGWMDIGYLPTAMLFKSKGVPVVVGFDDQWKGTLRQWVGKYVYKLFLSHCFSHAWVAGPIQYEFARQLGFQRNKIIFDMLSGDFELFGSRRLFLLENTGHLPKSFIYVGNFSKIKGTDTLVRAFVEYRETLGGDWNLICVGNGELEDILVGQSGITVYNYLEQNRLSEVMNDASVFILPSRHEQWGVVVHEFCSAGFPLLLSDEVGAGSLFLIEGFNGHSFDHRSVSDLAKKMLMFSQMGEHKIKEMSQNSLTLSSRITPETSAANFISLVRIHEQLSH